MHSMILRSSNVFIKKLHSILENDGFSSIIRWKSDNSFEILDRKKFCEVVLKESFKTTTFESFIRQLNKYNFKKKRSIDVFTNSEFTKSSPAQLDKIRIKKSIGTLERMRENTLALSMFNVRAVRLMGRITALLEKLLGRCGQCSDAVRVLLFEDFDVSELARKLREQCFEAETVFFYHDFEARISAREYHYLVIDEELFEIFSKVSRIKKRLPRIVLTSKHPTDRRVSGIYKRLVKPYDANQLAVALRKY